MTECAGNLMVVILISASNTKLGGGLELVRLARVGNFFSLLSSLLYLWTVDHIVARRHDRTAHVYWRSIASE